ncbi:MAG TPA: GNAT family N-acetyltransferase [Solirubrobacteraceae bacterium]|nr:GNAT family N-acetyltransferase [Solirubrobacteraceae bacterium]
MPAAELKVRRATAQDGEAFASVVAAVAAEERWIGHEPPVDLPAFAQRTRAQLEAGDVLWVLEQEGRVVGTLGLHATRAAGVMSVGMCILDEARGRGGGRLLMETVVAHALASPLHKVELEVWTDNARAIALYEAFGFEVEGERRRHYRRRDGTLRSVFIMARLLEDEPDQSRPGAGT